MKHLKRITLIVFSLILVFSYSAFAQEAQKESQKTSISDIKITIGYDSVFYKAKLFFERVRLINTFTSVGKANVSAIFAQRRMAEAALMADKEDFEAAQSLMIEGVGLMSQATDYAVDAMMHKDNGRTRLVLGNVNEAQAAMLAFLEDVSLEYPDTFDTEQMSADINGNVVDIMVVWAYVTYKENLFDDAQIRQNAIDALDNAKDLGGSISLDAITSATQDFVTETGEQLQENGVSLDAGADPTAADAVTSATQTGTEGTQGTDGTQTGTTTVDGTSSATTAAGGTEPAPVDPNAVDATSSATTTAGGTDPAPSGTGGVDATSSATPTDPSPSAPGTSLYFDDDDEEHEREYEHDDDDHEEHDDD